MGELLFYVDLHNFAFSRENSCFASQNAATRISSEPDSCFGAKNGPDKNRVALMSAEIRFFIYITRNFADQILVGGLKLNETRIFAVFRHCRFLSGLKL